MILIMFIHRLFKLISLRILTISILLPFILQQGQKPTTSVVIVEADVHVAKYPYLYGIDGNARASYPIIEYYAPTTTTTDVLSDEPDFLYSNQQERYRIVEYYVHWCNTCKNFVPHYKQLANRIQKIISDNNANNNIQIDIYAISCAPNKELCKKQQIRGFPKIRLYKPYDNIGIEILHTQLHPYRILNKMGIQINDSDELEEDEEDDEFSFDIDTAKIIKGDDDDDEHDENDNDIDDKSSNIIIRVPKWQRYFLNWIGVPVPDDDDDCSSQATNPKKKMTKNKKRQQSITNTNYYLTKRRSYKEIKNDIHLSFDFAMRTSIFQTDEPLTPRLKRILKEFLLLLQKTLPQSWNILHDLINDIITNFQYVTANSDYLDAVLNEYPPNATDWSPSCSYTCGLWSLFHAITIGVVEYNLISPDEDKYATESVALLIRDYIQHYFTCETCRNHFIEQYNSCEFQRCYILKENSNEETNVNDWQQLALWLFQTHNSVNIRLMKERATREHRVSDVTIQDEINMLWPSKKQCPRCWKEQQKQKSEEANISKSEEGVENEEEQDKKSAGNSKKLYYDTNSIISIPIYDEEMIYKYLKYEYGQHDSFSSDLKREISSLPETTIEMFDSIENAADLVDSESTAALTTTITTESTATNIVDPVILFYHQHEQELKQSHAAEDGKNNTSNNQINLTASKMNSTIEEEESTIDNPVNNNADEVIPLTYPIGLIIIYMIFFVIVSSLIQRHHRHQTRSILYDNDIRIGYRKQRTSDPAFSSNNKDTYGIQLHNSSEYFMNGNNNNIKK